MHRFRFMLLVFVALSVSLGGAASAGDLLYTVSSSDDNLRVVDPYNGQTLSTIQMSLTSGTIQQCNGLALNPGTQDLWVIVKVVGQPGRSLGRVNVTTGLITTVGTTGQNFAGITFNGAGTLFGVTGDGAQTPETLYTISLANAQTAQVMMLGNGNDGETIAHSAMDGLIYHASGLGAQNTNEIFEKINPSTRVVTNIPLSGDDYEEATALLHIAGGNFFLADLCQELFVVNDAGVVSLIGMMDHIAKGMAYLPATAAFTRLYGAGCAGPSGHIPVLVGRSTPAAGGVASLGLINGPGGALCMLVFGTGNGTQVLTPGCNIQIWPITPLFFPLNMSGTGPGNGKVAFSFNLPANLVATGFWQAAVFEGNSITLTNPVVMRVR